MRDLEGRDVGHYLAAIGHTVAHLEPALPAFAEHFGLLARVSRRPYGTIMFTASSTTEYVIRHGIAIAHGIDGAIRDRTICKESGISDEERELYRKCWPTLREPFSNSGWLLTYGRCVELAAEVDWEFHRTLGLLPDHEKKPVAPAGTVELFISYSHKDEKLRKKLLNHLRMENKWPEMPSKRSAAPPRKHLSWPARPEHPATCWKMAELWTSPSEKREVNLSGMSNL